MVPVQNCLLKTSLWSKVIFHTFKTHFSKSPRNTLGDVKIQEELLTSLSKTKRYFF